MEHQAFEQPVFLRLNQSSGYHAQSAGEALAYLDVYWTGPRTADYRRAKAMCRSAVDGLVSSESARRCLIEAASNAGILDDGSKFGQATSPIHGAANDNPGLQTTQYA